jgi:hypothetical protein
VLQYRAFEPAPLTFVVLPAVLVCLLAWGTAVAWRRSGASEIAARRASVQGFRLPLELAMHGMYRRGIMPVQMSYSGLNFDIVTGATAIAIGVLAFRGRAGRGIVTAWNILGLVLLINVVTVAILGTPRFRYFGEQYLNVWVTYPPFVWLPAVMVLAALAGHLLIFRALIRQRPAVSR